MVEITDSTPTTSELSRAIRREQPAIRFDNQTGEALLRLYQHQYDRLESDIEELYDERIVATATGSHLERIGTKYDIERKTNESDERLRKRIEARRLVGLSRGTYGDIAKLALVLFDTESSEIQLEPSSVTSEDGTGKVRVPTDLIDSSPFTEAEIADIISDAAIGGHRIVVENRDAFRWDDTNYGWGSPWVKTVE